MLEHNKIVYDEVIERLKTSSRVCIVQATGTGKGVIASSLIEDYVDVLVIAPTNAILENYRMNLGVNSENVIFYTYQGISMLLNNQIEELGEKVSLIILDEFHRIGAETWGRKVEMLCDRAEAKGCKTVGLSATPVRYLDNERDMSEEFFKGNVVIGVDIVDAVVDGVLPIFKYVASYYGFEKSLHNRFNEKDEEKKIKCSEKINSIVCNLENNYSISKIIKEETKSLSENQKWVIFFSNIEELENFKNSVYGWFNYSINLYVVHTHSNYSENMNVLKAFNNEKQGVNVLLCVNMLNEGVHISGIDGVIMLRKTISPIVYFQQFGRALQIGGKNPIIFDFIGNYRSVSDYTKYSEAFNFIEEINRRLCNERPESPIEKKVIVKSYCEEISNLIKEFNYILSGWHLWREEDEEILKKYYDTYGIYEINNFFLPHIPIHVLRRKAAMLGLKPKNKPYKERYKPTEHDLEVIKENYYKCSVKEINSLLPHMTENQIRSIASKLGISKGLVTKKQYHTWTKEEVEIVAKYYPIGGTELVHKYLPYLHKRIIMTRVDKLKLRENEKKVRKPRWTEEEHNILVKYYPTEGADVVKRLPNKSKESIGSRACQYGIKIINKQAGYASKLWTIDEDEIILKYYPTEGRKVYLRLKDRTIGSVAKRADVLGVKVENLTVEKKKPIGGHKWSLEEIELLKTYFPLEGYEVEKRLFNRTKKSIKHKVSQYGLVSEENKPANRIWSEEELNILKEYYPIEGSKVLERLPKRTYKSIHAKVEELKIRFIG